MSPLTEATAAFAERELVLVGDEHDERVFLACAADGIDASRLERLHELSRSTVILGLVEPDARRLKLPRPWSGADGRRDMGFTAPIDATAGIEDGWSLRDRARTMRVASDPNSQPGDVTIPGHVYPVLIDERLGNGAAAVIELARLSGRAPAVALCGVAGRHGRAASLHDAREHDQLRRLPVASPGELYSGWISRRAGELAISCSLPTRGGMFRTIGYGATDDDPATVALVHGDPSACELPLVHVHIACLFGDAFGSTLCDCRGELDEAARIIVEAGAGVVVYAKPDQPVPVACARGQKIDAVLVSGLLRAAGVDRLRLLDDGRSARLRDELRTCGLEVAA
jgi:3,4-dihydroxy 2-butanone 4-phosphate synthase/GTP cyclohydrolase II